MNAEDLKPELSVTERIKIAGAYLGVSKREIEQEMTKLFAKKDSIGIKEMFEAYFDWEIRQAHTTSKRRTLEEIKALALDNFDYVAKVTDNRRVTGNDQVSAMVMGAKPSTEIVGPITQFYREAVEYNPQYSRYELN